MCLVLSGLGAASWNVLAEGVSIYLGLSFGWTTNLIALVVLVAWIPMKEMPGIGTVLNVFLVGISADVTALYVEPANHPVHQAAYFVIGLLAYAFFDATYLGAQLGAGPRDGLMTGLTRITGRSVRSVRTGIEIVVALSGWLLGGTVGIGTVLISLLVGPLIAGFLPIVAVRLPRSDRPSPPASERAR